MNEITPIGIYRSLAVYFIVTFKFVQVFIDKLTMPNMLDLTVQSQNQDRADGQEHAYNVCLLQPISKYKIEK